MFVNRKQQEKMGIVQDSPRHFVTAAPAQAAPQAMPPSTAITVQPIKPSALLDSHNALIGVYREQYKQGAQVGEVLPADTGNNGAHGYSSAAELQARNARFYFTVGALVLVEAIAAWGMVSTANIATWIGDVWTVPIWLSLTGIAAFVTIQHVYAGEQRLSPENIELVRAENQFAIEHMDAKTRQLAIRLAARNDRERLQLERDQQQLQRESNHRLTLETQARINDQMARHTTPQHDRNRLNTYHPTAAQRGPVCPQEWLGGPVNSAPMGYDYDTDMDAPSAVLPVEQAAPIVDPVRQCLLNFVSDLYLDYSHDGESNTKKYNRMHADGRLQKGTIVPWAQRSNLTAAERRQMEELLRQITPSLFSYDSDKKQWALNLASYPRVYMAVDAIGRAFTPNAT